MSTPLFPPTAKESHDWLKKFVDQERGKRVAMLQRHSDKRTYWQGRIIECDEADLHVDNLLQLVDIGTE